MAQEPRDIVLEHLRYMRRQLDHLVDSMGSLNSRTTAMERHMAGMYTSDVEQTAELERLK